MKALLGSETTTVSVTASKVVEMDFFSLAAGAKEGLGCMAAMSWVITRSKSSLCCEVPEEAIESLRTSVRAPQTAAAAAIAG